MPIKQVTGIDSFNIVCRPEGLFPGGKQERICCGYEGTTCGSSRRASERIERLNINGPGARVLSRLEYTCATSEDIRPLSL